MILSHFHCHANQFLGTSKDKRGKLDSKDAENIAPVCGFNEKEVDVLAAICYPHRISKLWDVFRGNPDLMHGLILNPLEYKPKQVLP